MAILTYFCSYLWTSLTNLNIIYGSLTRRIDTKSLTPIFSGSVRKNFSSKFLIRVPPYLNFSDFQHGFFGNKGSVGKKCKCETIAHSGKYKSLEETFVLSGTVRELGAKEISIELPRKTRKFSKCLIL